MTVLEVLQLLGPELWEEREKLSESTFGDTHTVMYSWKNRDGSNMNAMFQGGGPAKSRLITKAQFGLP